MGESGVGSGVQLDSEEGAGGMARAGLEVSDGGVESVADASYYSRLRALEERLREAESDSLRWWLEGERRFTPEFRGKGVILAYLGLRQ